MATKAPNQSQIYKWDDSKDRLDARIKALEAGNSQLRFRRGGFGPVTGQFTRVDNQALNSAGAISLSSSSVIKVGSIPPTANTNGFSYVASDTTITWYWDGTNGSQLIVLRRADGTIQVIPAGSITISGLTASTTYYFYPFWTPFNRCNIGWVIGTVGDPMIAFVLADLQDPDGGPAAVFQQALQDREALTAGSMTATTGAAGGGVQPPGQPGGGGDPHGGGGCVMGGTDIQPLGDYPYTVEVLPETQWIRLVTEAEHGLNCTHDHPVFHAIHGKTVAKLMKVGDLILTDSGEEKLTTVEPFVRSCSKRLVRMEKGHLFFANGILSHNKVNNK